MDRIGNFDLLNHGHLDLLDNGIFFGVVMMNRVNFVRDLDFDNFAVLGKGKFLGFFDLFGSRRTYWPPWTGSTERVISTKRAIDAICKE
jgi:hypothetical protein